MLMIDSAEMLLNLVRVAKCLRVDAGVDSLPQYSGNMVQFERYTATVILLAKGANID